MCSMPYQSRAEIAADRVDEVCAPWQRVVFDEFAATIASPQRPFPCVFGVAGFTTDQLRYVFIDDAGPDGIRQLGVALRAFIARARAIGPNTSLVAFFRPDAVGDIEQYRRRMWTVLTGLRAVDEHPWPAAVPADPDDPLWEFCYAGEPVFVVCNTPAHVARQSRRASSFMLTFQPRWVFDRILGTDAAADVAFTKVRRRLAVFDMLPASPDLGRYGAAEVREHRQYFLDDANRPAPVCPFRGPDDRQPAARPAATIATQSETV